MVTFVISFLYFILDFLEYYKRFPSGTNETSGFAQVGDLGSPALTSINLTSFIGIKAKSTTDSCGQKRAKNHPHHLLSLSKPRPCMKYISVLHLLCHLASGCGSSITDQLLVHLCLSVSFSALQGKMKCISVHKLPLMGCTSPRPWKYKYFRTPHLEFSMICSAV